MLVNFQIGCTTCANICPAQAIAFPDKRIVRQIEREHKILAIVRKEAATKEAKLDAEMVYQLHKMHGPVPSRWRPVKSQAEDVELTV